MKAIYTLHAQGRPLREIAKTLQVSRNTVRKYVRSPELPKPKPQPRRGSKLRPYLGYIQGRLAENVVNCAVLLRELRQLGYTGGCTILKDFVKPLRRYNLPVATVRFETKPGEQAQIDWGKVRYKSPDGTERSLYAFVMVLGWSRAPYVEFTPKADMVSFLKCHLHAFEELGIPQRCLYDNTKLVTLGRGEDGEVHWNPRFLDFSRRMGFDPDLCRPYRARTKGKVENGVKYVKGNFWPSAKFTDLADLNQQARAWVRGTANPRVHGTTHERPLDRLESERAHLRPFPGWAKVQDLLYTELTVGSDGFVRWEYGYYGVPSGHLGSKVTLNCRDGIVEIWQARQRLAVHPRTTRRGERHHHPNQWQGLTLGDPRPQKDPMAVMLPGVEVEHRPLAAYANLVAGVQA